AQSFGEPPSEVRVSSCVLSALGRLIRSGMLVALGSRMNRFELFGLSLLALFGCAEPEEVVASSDHAATARAPEDAEVEAMKGHKAEIVKSIVIAPNETTS